MLKQIICEEFCYGECYDRKIEVNITNMKKIFEEKKSKLLAEGYSLVHFYHHEGGGYTEVYVKNEDQSTNILIESPIDDSQDFDDEVGEDTFQEGYDRGFIDGYYAKNQRL